MMESEALRNLIFFFLVAIAATLHILNAWGLNSIAQRRGLHKPWLAWIPICNSWILGSISDRYQLSVRGKKTSRRKILLGMQCVLILAAIPIAIVGGAVLYAFLVGRAPWFPVIVWLIYGIWIVYRVFACMAQYDLYRSCMPDNAVVFLVLSIFFEFLTGIFVFVCRDHDRGLEPKQENSN